MNMTINFRQAIPKDMPKIMNLLRQVNDVHAEGRPDLFRHGHTKYSEDQLIGIMANPLSPIFVATDEEDHAIAYCFSLIQDHSGSNNLQPVKTLYIDDLCVDEMCRGRNVGRKLYDYVKSYAKENGFYNITLNVWTCNSSAIRFYESLGMSPMKIAMEDIIR